MKLNNCKIEIWSLILITILILSITSPVWAFSFVVFGDNRDGDEIFKALIQKVNQEEDIVFAVNTGDFVPTGTGENYKKYLKIIANCKVKVINVIGNHELLLGGKKRYEKWFGRTYWSWDFENAHFIKLDNVSPYGGLGEPQYHWLIEDLVGNEKEHVFIFFHKPLKDPTGSWAHYEMRPKKFVEELLDLFKENRVKYVFTGHIHGYVRTKLDGIIQIITGGAGAPLYPPEDKGGFYHYLKITVDEDQIKDQVRRVGRPLGRH